LYGTAQASNLFDKSKATLDKYVNWDNGELWENANYAASDFIPVEPGQQYMFDGFNRGLAYYNASKQYVSGQELPPNTVTIPTNCYYMRVTPNKADIDTFTVYKVKEHAEQFKLFLPNEICVAVGRTIELYNSQVSWCSNIDDYHFKWDCAIGKAMKRKFSVTGKTELIGTYPLNLTVFNNDMDVVATASTTIKVVSDIIATPKTLLTIGDSLTNNKPWMAEVRTLSNNQITMVGTRGTAPLQHEGRSGWSAATYLTGASYTYENEGVNPFWNGTRFDWNYYKRTTGINPDAVQIYLGTNGMELDPTANAGNIKQIVDYIRQDDADIPIYIVFTLYRGDQNGIGQEDGAGVLKLDEDLKVFNLIVKLNELLSEYSNLYFIPISLCHDSEYNFGAVEVPVNPRAVQTELIPVEATHPQLQGYLQMADIMFSVFAAHQ